MRKSIEVEGPRSHVVRGRHLPYEEGRLRKSIKVESPRSHVVRGRHLPYEGRVRKEEAEGGGGRTEEGGGRRRTKEADSTPESRPPVCRRKLNRACRVPLF